MRAIDAPPLVLEPLLEAHAHEMFAVLGDPALYEFENQPPLSEAALADRYRLLESRQSPDGSQHWLNWVIRLPSGELAGCVQATVLGDGAALIAYELASRHWRRGIGSAAVSAMLEELRLGYDVVLHAAVLKAANYRSIGLLRKLGFQPASAAQFERFGAEPDEVVFTRPATTNPPPLRIAQLTADDLHPYRALMLHGYEHSPDAFTSQPAERAAQPDAWWIRRLADPSGLTAAFGAFDRDALVGTVAIEYSSKPKTRHKAAILGMYVLPEARGKGAARALLAEALAHCRARGDVTVVQLTVTDGNEPAVALYRSFGFEPFGLEPKAIRGDSQYFAKLHMWLDLEAASPA